jgi:hypothetical protein
LLSGGDLIFAPAKADVANDLSDCSRRSSD